MGDSGFCHYDSVTFIIEVSLDNKTIDLDIDKVGIYIDNSLRGEGPILKITMVKL